MKTSVIIISALLVLSVFVPFFLFIYNGSKQSSKIKKQIKTLLKGNYSNYKQKEIWRNNFIGINHNDQSLTYVSFKEAHPYVVTFNFNTLKSCTIAKEHASGKHKSTHIKQLDLELNFNGTNSSKTRIPFFNIDQDITEDFELQRIEKWHKFITQSIIPKNKFIKQAS